MGKSFNNYKIYYILEAYFFCFCCLTALCVGCCEELGGIMFVIFFISVLN